MMELLSPAPSPEAVTAAVQNGADAVYMSFDDLSDSRRAVNFLDDGFEAAVRYCRVRGCKTYLSMNVPLRQDELQKAGGLALRAQRAGVDAIILRDMGLFAILRRLLPEMPLFADHRMGFYTPESAVVAQSLGFQRIFLPPEMPLDEICRMAQAPIETAVFVQTSLCAAAAGTCRMSAMSGRGSADRGWCAMPCREAFSLGGRWDSTPLSWKDRSLLGSVPRLKEAGVDCLCIGDRDKRVEYVALYTSELRHAMEDDQQPAAPDRETMERVFSEYGVAKERVFERAEPHKEDSRAVERYCAPIRQAYTATELRRVGVTFAVAGTREDRPIMLGAKDEDGRQAIIEGPMPDPAGDLPMTEEALREAMYRTAGTPFRCEDLELAVNDALHIDAIALDEARRRLLYSLSEERSKVPDRKEGPFPRDPVSKVQTSLPVVNFAVQTADQLTPELAALQPDTVYVPLEVLYREPECVRPFLEQECRIAAALPSVACGPQEEKELRDMLSAVREQGVECALAGNMGLALMASQEGFSLRGDLDLAMMNGFALQSLARAGFLSAAVSPELSLVQIRELPKPLDTELVIYGRLSAMVTETCLLKESAGRCVCSAPGQMADTHGGVWPVTKHFGCRNTVWMSKKIWIGDAAEEWIQSGLWAVRLNFSTESPRECLDVARACIQGEPLRLNGMTRGLYFRGTK